MADRGTGRHRSGRWRSSAARAGHRDKTEDQPDSLAGWPGCRSSNFGTHPSSVHRPARRTTELPRWNARTQAKHDVPRRVLNAPMRAAARTTLGVGFGLRFPGLAAAPNQACDPERGVRCARVNVTMDYDDPLGSQISLRLARLPATDPARRIGTLFVNAGGSGNSAVDFVILAAQEVLSPRIRAPIRHRRLRRWRPHPFHCTVPERPRWPVQPGRR